MAKEWKPTIKLVPRKKQYSFGGVLVVLKPPKTKMTVNGPEVIEAGDTINIEFGADNQGTLARNEAEEEKLLELANDPKCDICLWEDREMEPIEREADKLRLKEKERADAAEAYASGILKQLAASGIRVEDGKVITPK